MIKLQVTVLATLLLATSAQAEINVQPRRESVRPVPMTDRVTSTQSASDTASEASSDYVYGVGFATANHLTFTDTSVTGWLELGDGNAIQAFAALGGVDPFAFGIGGLFKRTVIGTQASGVHFGGGVGIGTTAGGGTSSANSNFTFALSGVAGFHFIVPNTERILINLDGGPTMTIVDDDVDFTVGALSPVLGLSVLFLF
jgi:hypothetical protein